ncbi:sugar ABC transporter ATP-binding protein [Amnibacterium flavum]|uniref:Sugar ABC transporter ATP-binding protein n=1 Tax=Amnibacterium flavum TaxID=2173173 RepID=A0A2V1HPX3_9MICO|nr:sugar ABC transporter ATP-binding protein [Amnibacterium flavum]PVZ94588.1 sugar ABC transporter ATP-binding protein [Amnibacterium flavum]
MTVELTGLTKRYGATTALDSVDLTVESGEVHALLGHNGAGKSTLIKCLGGSVRPTSGTIALDGRPLENLTPRSAIDAGISVIYQHLGLIDGLTVSENLFLGNELTAGLFVRSRSQRIVAAESLARIGADIDPDIPVGALSSGGRQMVAIAKAIQRDAKLLILDEPTAALSPVEAAALGRLVLQLRAEGLAILYVTHLLNEVMTLADRVTVLRNGRAVWAAHMAGTAKGDLVRAISDSAGEAPAEASNVDRSGVPALRVPAAADGVDLEVFPGEIVALYGLMGAGRTKLLESVYGSRPSSRREVELSGEAVTLGSPGAALAAQVALVPADRHSQGLFLSLPAQENSVTRAMAMLARLGFRSPTREREVFDEAASLMSLKPHNPALPAERFSGGNQQKILISRWVTSASDARILLVDDPTQGVDVGARTEIYAVLRDLAREKGMAILVSTNEPEEVIALADRCAFMADGAVTGIVDVPGTTAEELLSTIHPSDADDHSDATASPSPGNRTTTRETEAA